MPQDELHVAELVVDVAYVVEGRILGEGLEGVVEFAELLVEFFYSCGQVAAVAVAEVPVEVLSMSSFDHCLVVFYNLSVNS